ncbi:MAG: Eco57I restriction-modification methylase domain-containing protein [Candidatus Hodarchaeota archaeon]
MSYLKEKKVAQAMMNDFGLRSGLAPRVIRHFQGCLEKELESDSITSIFFNDWKESFRSLHGKISQEEGKIKVKELSNAEFKVDKLLFVLYTYYILVIEIFSTFVFSRNPREQVLNECFGDTVKTRAHLDALKNGLYFKRTCNIENYYPQECFFWYTSCWRGETGIIIKRLAENIHDCFEKIDFSSFNRPDEGFLDNFYQTLIPRSIRHDLGEFYTPSWLAELILDEAGYGGSITRSILDPSCGSGVFLMECIKKTIEFGKDKSKISLVQAITSNIMGFDINPIAVFTAKTNYLRSLFMLLKESKFKTKISIPVIRFDSILDDESEIDIKSTQFDFLVGNPPWVKWDFLSREYKEKIKQNLQEYSLFSHKGMAAGLGYSHDDISVVFTYLVMDRFLKQGGILGFILKQTLYKGMTGKDFRNFCIKKDGA